MKNLIYNSLLSTLIFTSAVHAQEKSNGFKPEVTPVGVYLNIGAAPQKGDRVVVWRNTGKVFETVASLNAASTKAAFYQRMQNQAMRFPDYYHVTEQVAGNLWNMIQSGKQDSIRNAGIPVVLLAMGAAFLDTTANLPAGTRYRVQLGDKEWDSGEIGDKPLKVAYNQIVFHQLQPAQEAIRAEWRLSRTQQLPLLEVQRQRIGIDSNFVALKTDLGFEKTAKGDSISVHLSDTTVLAGINYQYYLTGKDYLGRVISRSDTVRSFAGNRATVAGLKNLVTREAADSSGIELLWSKPAVNSIRSIRVFRSAYYDSAYVQVAVLPAADTSWVDLTSAMGINYYYQVIAQGDGDFAIPSLRVFGSYMNNSRLMPPSSVTVTAVEAGTALNWKYHSYMNLLGFRVYRMQGNTGKFEAISDLIPARKDSLVFSYVDKKQASSGDQSYTYAITAVGRNDKESPLSGIVQSNVSEKGLLPVPLQVRSLQLDDDKVSITWQDMSASNPSVTGYHVYRKAIGADSVKGFVRLTTEAIANANEFEDAPGRQNAWQYVVRSVSYADRSAYSLPVGARVYGAKPLPPGKVYAFGQKSSVVLHWDGTQIPGIGTYHVYRASVGAEPKLVGSVPYSEKKHTYEDKNVSGGELYFYYVTTKTLDGVESERSREVSIRPK